MNLQATEQTIVAPRPVTMPRPRTIIYWVVSAPVLLETAVGAEWDLVRIPFVREIFAHLGYPLYLLTILGVAKLLAVIGLVTPRARRVKEWAYTRRVLRLRGSRLLALRDRRWRRQDRDASCLRGVDAGVVGPEEWIG